MRLIVGLTLSPPEQAALREGYDVRDQIAAKLCAVDLTPPDAREQNGLEMLAAGSLKSASLARDVKVMAMIFVMASSVPLT
jgi:hypothetical protein